MAESDPKARDAVESLADETTDDHLEPVAPERVELPPLQALNVFAVYDDEAAARGAIVGLERKGIESHNISALALDPSQDVEPGAETADTHDKDAKMFADIGSDVAKGAGIGAVAGALGSAAVALAIPGVGAAIGAGILAVAAGGAFAGTGVGGVAGAIASTPASSEWEQAFVDLEHGRVVIGVHTDDRALFDTAHEVLADSGALAVRLVDSEGKAL